MNLFQLLLPEVVLVVAACALFLIGFVRKGSTTKLSAALALGATIGAAAVATLAYIDSSPATAVDSYNSIRIGPFAAFVRMIVACVGVLLIALAWPVRDDGGPTLHVGKDAGEFFGLALLSLAGVLLVGSANDLVLLFMAIELASIPTYILVASSRPLARAQEAGVKYFFLGALSAAVLLMGMAYLYGTTGTTTLVSADGPSIAGEISRSVRESGVISSWQLLAVVLVTIGLAFKLAAVPMHAYVADVYEGAATPVTALIGVVPKAVGVIALVKLLSTISGGPTWWDTPEVVDKLLWALAVLTMTVGNVLALAQRSVKRIFAYSSVAHSGYLLAGITAVGFLGSTRGESALGAVLFYLAVYSVMSVAAFGVLNRLPTKQTIEINGKKFIPPATTAETLDDLAGTAFKHPGMTAVMVIACLSLTGLPLTAGFWGKVYLILPVIESGDGWLIGLAIVLLVNSAIAAAYYLRVAAAMFASPLTDEPAVPDVPKGGPAGIAVGLAACAIVMLGVVLPATQLLSLQAREAAHLETVVAPTPVPAGEVR